MIWVCPKVTDQFEWESAGCQGRAPSLTVFLVLQLCVAVEFLDSGHSSPPSSLPAVTLPSPCPHIVSGFVGEEVTVCV